MAKDRILIVDDERDMRELLEIMLRKEGYEPVGLPSAKLALDRLKNEEFDLVISDVRMPVMDGLDFLKALREGNPEALVIMITAYASVETAIEAMKAGAHDYVIKGNLSQVRRDHWLFL